MDFSEALKALKQGQRVARSGWNGKRMWLALVKANQWGFVNHNEIRKAVNEAELLLLPFIIMRTADDKLVPWLASQTDILAADWEIIE